MKNRIKLGKTFDKMSIEKVREEMNRDDLLNETSFGTAQSLVDTRKSTGRELSLNSLQFMIATAIILYNKAKKLK